MGLDFQRGYLKNGASRAVRTLRAHRTPAGATGPAPTARVVPLTGQQIGQRFTAADAAGEKILTELHDLAKRVARLPAWASTRLLLRDRMDRLLFRHTNHAAVAAIDLGKAASKSDKVRAGIRHFAQLVSPHLIRPGYRVRRAKGAPERAKTTPRKDRGPGDADIHFRATTVPAHTITHELGHTLEF